VRRLLEDRRAAGCSILVSTHNLDEAERIADRVAVLDRRLLALDRTTALRRRLTTGRLFVRLDGDVNGMMPLLRRFDPHATVEDGAVVVRVSDLERDTPAIVASLASAGARVLEVRPEMPPLEDVYMHLVGEKPERLERPV
jgi:ABC-2 type transport system ATP-binding protein